LTLSGVRRTIRETTIRKEDAMGLMPDARSSVLPALPVAFLCALSVLLLAACETTDNGILPSPPDPPPPVLITEEGGVSISTVARELNRGLSGHLGFTQPAYALTMTVSGYGGGVFRLELRDAYGNILRQEAITRDTTLVDSSRSYHPAASVTALFEGFTGRVELRVRPADAVNELPWFEFPHRAGTRWVYHRRSWINSTYPVHDTVRVVAQVDLRTNRVFRDSVLAGRWELRYSAEAYVRPANCFLYFDDGGVTWINSGIPWDYSDFPPGMCTRLPFPLRENSRWQSGFPGSNNYWGFIWTPGRYSYEADIGYRGPVIAGGTSYPESYRVDQYGGPGVRPLLYSAWVVPNIGIVRIDVDPNDPFERGEVWNLLEFSEP
jgi:hypothetical protein